MDSVWICLPHWRLFLNLQCFSTGVTTGAEEIMLKHPCCCKANESAACMTVKTTRCSCRLASNIFPEVEQAAMTLQLESRGAFTLWLHKALPVLFFSNDPLASILGSDSLWRLEKLCRWCFQIAPRLIKGKCLGYFCSQHVGMVEESVGFHT